VKTVVCKHKNLDELPKLYGYSHKPQKWPFKIRKPTRLCNLGVSVERQIGLLVKNKLNVRDQPEKARGSENIFCFFFTVS
jgi:hypothetical protein